MLILIFLEISGVFYELWVSFFDMSVVNSEMYCLHFELSLWSHRKDCIIIIIKYACECIWYILPRATNQHKHYSAPLLVLISKATCKVFDGVKTLKVP